MPLIDKGCKKTNSRCKQTRRPNLATVIQQLTTSVSLYLFCHCILLYVGPSMAEASSARSPDPRVLDGKQKAFLPDKLDLTTELTTTYLPPTMPAAPFKLDFLLVFTLIKIILFQITFKSSSLFPTQIQSNPLPKALCLRNIWPSEKSSGNWNQSSLLLKFMSMQRSGHSILI